ncbi:methyl-accepting chemotaxis protein [Domibacillus tundrae]|uniref:methyl-accepting chemotaxis protein n=1 Tax=Domibacillus tundrae TaxID=1587527 RepID=UPI0006180DA7|nr:methyl-accepting chemotaxis protein [Domibacillus tundrae]
MNILEALTQSAPFFQMVIKGDVTLGVVDKESQTFLCYLPSKKVDFGIKEGDPVNPQDQNVQTALRGEVATVTVPENVYGIPINATAFPVTDERGKVVGALAFGFPLDTQQKIAQYMGTVKSIIDSLQDKVYIIASHSEELAAASEEVKGQSKIALEDSKKTHSVIEFICSVSRQTNLLGLNASIEAARSGQYGAGFNVVAQEIRKLSSETSHATESIEEALRNITGNINNLMENMTQINGASNDQANLVQDFRVIIEKLNAVSDEMSAFMKEVVR